MFELVYTLFFFVLILEVIIFLFLNLPTPHGWKAVIIKFLNTNKHVKTLMKAHLGFCLLSAVFLYDCFKQEDKYALQKLSLKGKDSYGSQLRYNYLAFMILKVQRNKYITSMLIYASLALNAYVWLLNYMYEKRERHQQSLKQAKQASEIKESAKELTKIG